MRNAGRVSRPWRHVLLIGRPVHRRPFTRTSHRRLRRTAECHGRAGRCPGRPGCSSISCPPVVDPERFPDEWEEMPAAGMVAVYTRTTHGEELRRPGADVRPPLRRYFDPYARALTAAVAGRLEAAGRAVIIDTHSYPLAGCRTSSTATGRVPRSASARTPSRRPPSCGTRRARRARASAVRGSTVRSRGTYVPLRYYGRDPGVRALMAETGGPCARETADSPRPQGWTRCRRRRPSRSRGAGGPERVLRGGGAAHSGAEDSHAARAGRRTSGRKERCRGRWASAALR
ncbi:N-formylglutamate amidohydrolase [Streptomyces sp. NPDC013953]|uniref:N-formylglutamate amidohydrolase n=1 Tax=Streptomyces sp. NPDC013953 TaxID=3364868 RepID=UPI00370369B4